MMKIFHGDQIIKSRAALVSEMEAAHRGHIEVERVSAKNLTEASLEQLLGSQSLFDTDRLIVIEELHSLPRSKKKNQFIKMVAAADLPIILWEKRALTKTMLKQFPDAKVDVFKASNKLFPWLDSLGGKNKKQQLTTLQELKKQEGAGFVFAMLSRQIRLLIASLDDGRVKGAPFVVAKLRKQAQQFSLPQLLMAHASLLDIDYRQKQSGRQRTLDQELDLWLLSL